MAKPSELLLRTKIGRGVVTNPARGRIQLEDKIGTLLHIQSTLFEKYEENTIVEFTYKLLPNGNPSIIKVTPVDKNEEYEVYVAAFDTNQPVTTSMMNEFVQIVTNYVVGIGLSREQTDDLMTHVNVADIANKFGLPDFIGVTIMDGLNYAQAVHISKGVQSQVGEIMQVEKRKTGRRLVNAVKAAEHLDGFEAPEWVDGDYWFSPSMRKIATVIHHLMEAGEHFNLMLSGDSGYGKTSNCEGLARMLGSDYEFIRINCAQITDSESWFGYQEARGGDTVFIPTRFTELVRRGKAVILLDEVNRIEPWLHNILFPLLDHARRTEVHGHEIVCGPSIVFAFTMNNGVKFSGTFVLDGAFMNRLDATEEVEAPDAPIEVKLVMSRVKNSTRDQVQSIVSLLRELRGVVDRNALDVDVSTRTAIKIGRLHINGMAIEDAVTFVVTNTMPRDDRKSILDVVKSRMFKK